MMKMHATIVRSALSVGFINMNPHGRLPSRLDVHLAWTVVLLSSRLQPLSPMQASSCVTMLRVHKFIHACCPPHGARFPVDTMSALPILR